MDWLAQGMGQPVAMPTHSMGAMDHGALPRDRRLSVSGSSFLVAVNALMLRRLRLPTQYEEAT